MGRQQAFPIRLDLSRFDSSENRADVLLTGSSVFFDNTTEIRKAEGFAERVPRAVGSSTE
jgi:hypothetical protein